MFNARASCFSSPCCLRGARHPRKPPARCLPIRQSCRSAAADDGILLEAVRSARAAAAIRSDGRLHRQQIWNPATQRFDKVHLRSYTGDGVNPDAPFVAPVIEVRPGQTISMTLHNSCRPIRAAHRTCGGREQAALFQRHQPAFSRAVGQSVGNSDNVLLSINHRRRLEYIYICRPTIRPASSGTIRIGMARPRCRCRAAWRAP